MTTDLGDTIMFKECVTGRTAVKHIYIYRVIHEVLPPLREGIPEVIWNKKC
jgi:hypothetical protein